MGGRGLVAGLPRSGTSWFLKVVGAHPAIRTVFEPDHRNQDMLGWLGTGVVGALPSLVPGAPAPDYRQMWAVAFAGGWPEAGRRAASVLRLRKVAMSKAPARVRAAALRRAAGIAAREVPDTTVLVKSVAVQLSLEWVTAEFAPTVLVVWRHPLNVVASWQELGWATTELVASRPAVRDRFVGSPLWPPTPGGLEGTAWSVCAQTTLLLEAAGRIPGALVFNHEDTTSAPEEGARRALAALGLDWHPVVGDTIDAMDRPGTGWVTNRRTAEEAARWRSRLSEDDAALGAPDDRSLRRARPRG